MEVILREHVDNLGQRGDVVKVADGYARNYLLPRKLALPATDGNKRHVERERKIMEVKEADEKAQAQAIASRIEAIDVVITRRVGETEQLYGSVTSADIAEYLKGKGFEIDRRKLILPEAIKTTPNRMTTALYCISTEPTAMNAARNTSAPRMP